MTTRALVTGGSGSIGRAICLALGETGLEVIVHGCAHRERAEAVAQSIRDKGGQAEAVCFDVTDVEQTRQALERLHRAGPIQVLVHNAGIYDDAPMAGMTLTQWKSVIDVSLNGFFNVTQPLLLPMIRTRWGRIVTITSVSGLIGNRGQVNYAAAKAGLHGATKALALELASRHITVNAVAPGIISTPETQALFDRDAIGRLVPMKRAGTVEEVASLVSYLVSDVAAFVSGQIISVNGAQA
ncbi:MAG: fabG [Nitrospira sp.]|jgi:3-oxoacyl-[acyl-carrier protein] reductase|nr:fabG [Nitrospira sp.]